jgi:hypothetical protein
MPWLPPGVDPNILSSISPEQWVAWMDGAEIGPAPHTLEQQALGAGPSDKVEQVATSTLASPAPLAEPTAVPQPQVIHRCTVTKDFFLPTLGISFKKGMRGQLLEEREETDGRKMVRIFLKDVTDQNGAGIMNTWVSEDCVEKGEVG